MQVMGNLFNKNKTNKQTNKNYPVGEKQTGWLAGKAELDKAGQGWTRLDKAGQGWTRLDKAGQGWTRLDKAGQGWTRLDRTQTTSNIR